MADQGNTTYESAQTSTARRDLASFENAYRVAAHLAQETGEDQLVIETGDVRQSFRVIRANEIQPGARWCGTRIHTVRAHLSVAA